MMCLSISYSNNRLLVKVGIAEFSFLAVGTTPAP
jgi:hypothetical protein